MIKLQEKAKAGKKVIKKWVYGLVACLIGLIWLIINIRVEAGAATSLEKAVDGLVGGVVLLVIIFGAVSFFGTPGKK